MTEHIAPRADNAPWWQRYQAQLECEFRLTPGMLPAREWLFKAEAKFERAYRGYQCLWPRASLRLLGFFVGAGLFVRGRAIPTANAPEADSNG